MKKLIAGNWKMNGNIEGAKALASEIEHAVKEAPEVLDACELLVCPPYPYLASVESLVETVKLGAQNCSHHGDGAYTGDVSAHMVKDCGASYVIVGHSERRQYHEETDMLVSWKAAIAHENDLITIICVGETLVQRKAGDQERIVGDQLLESIPETATAENTVIAYEPVWAIGTGNTATAEDVEKMHSFIRKVVSEQVSGGDSVRILYGGSMKPDNAAELLATPNVDGGLIGGASLKADQFIAIAKSARLR